MVVRGQVQNGVVVLADGIRFPEGKKVTVIPLDEPTTSAQPHSVLEIPKVSLGAVLSRPTDDDLLGEMLEARR
jgi:hypothetical protein